MEEILRNVPKGPPDLLNLELKEGGMLHSNEIMQEI